MSGKRKQHESAVNGEGWLMSYADMTTILLSLFIVLTTLGQDQTGINFSKGVESFRESQHQLGLPGLFSSSGTMHERDAPMPHYSLEGDAGPESQGRSIDAEEEQLQSFLGELSRLYDTQKLPRAAGEAVVDLFAPLRESGPHLQPAHWEVVNPILASLHQPRVRVTVIVWTPTPGARAWKLTAKKAVAILGELRSAIPEGAEPRVTVQAQPWPHRDFQRPVLSVAVTRVAS